MSLICDFRSLLCPTAECHSKHGVLTTVDPMYIWQLMLKMIRTGGRKGFGMDGQQRDLEWMDSKSVSLAVTELVIV
jgi:hypothetical protein